LALSRAKRATAVTAVCGLLVAGCGGTLEGKYRRGQITTSTTGGTQTPATSPTTANTAPTVPTSGNAAESNHRVEPDATMPGGTIGESAVRRAIAAPLGGRHR
jgi:hypothetical protein